ncbi:MAG: STAS domain-containing protein, partial [Cyanobacteria bacterium]|nr:STAS domain-containing protein [Cyanobacteriota bacterium]
EQIPLAALSAVLILTGFRLIEWEGSKQIWRSSRREGWVLLLTIAVSVFVGLTAGVFVGMAITCFLFISHMSTALVLTRHDADGGSTVPQPIPTCKDVRTYLVDGPLFFGAAERFTETILQIQNPKVVVLHLKALTVVDLTGVETLRSIHAQLTKNGVRLCLTEASRQTLELLKQSGVLDAIGKENYFQDYKECLLDVNMGLLETTTCGCMAVLKGGPGAKVPASSCPLQSGIILNTNRVRCLLTERMEATGEKSQAQPELDMSKLVGVRSDKDIPVRLRGTPVEALLKAQNLCAVDHTPGDQADLIIGMCIDYRKQLHLPKNCAYIIRSPGANMKQQEFGLVLAVSAGIKYMALITHNKCLMSDPHAKEAVVLETLCSCCGWQAESAKAFFAEEVTTRAIADPVEFAMRESKRLSSLFHGLNVVPLLYCVDDDKLYLIADWLQTPDAVASECTEPK